MLVVQDTGEIAPCWRFGALLSSNDDVHIRRTSERQTSRLCNSRRDHRRNDTLLLRGYHGYPTFAGQSDGNTGRNIYKHDRVN
jgi:hypothetical protein